MPDSVRPHRRQPTRLPRPWDSPGKNTGVGCHFLLQCMKVKRKSEVTQSCLNLSDPMDRSLPGSSVHRIFQARVLEWGAIAFSDKQISRYIFTFIIFKAINKISSSSRIMIKTHSALIFQKWNTIFWAVFHYIVIHLGLIFNISIKVIRKYYLFRWY